MKTISQIAEEIVRTLSLIEDLEWDLKVAKKKFRSQHKELELWMKNNVTN